ncbi:MAG TPA: alpha-L-fucosidase, partial [Candidatus Lokiarchaeia archaeon]|nr:alpha-L-fucosidase [Candidatus Lokiarchaeia archaeon]
NRWNAKNMGPQRDVVGELAVAIRKQGMKFITTFHHGNLWYYYNHDPALDTGDPQYSDFYGKAHAATNGEGMSSPRFDRPDQEFCEIWFAKLKEVIDGYRPDLLWFDFDLNWIPDKYKRKMAAYYYNAAEEWGTEVEIIYKDQGPGHFHMAPGMGLLDYERGRSGKLTKYKWMTDTSLGRKSWCYIEDEEYLPTSALVHSFIDRIAKNGYLLLNFGPRADGTIPDPVQDTFREFGKWLEVNMEAIFGSTPWVIAEEGPTRLEKEGGFNDDQDYTQAYTAEDIRFTTKGNALYAFSLGWPEDTLFIRTLTAPPVGWREYPELHFYLVEESDIASITLLGCDEALRWEITTQGLKITPPVEKPCDHAYCFKISWS